MSDTQNLNNAADGGLPRTPCSASEYRGSRCPECLWGLYDGDWCQGPAWCVNRGNSVKTPARLTNGEAAEAIYRRTFRVMYWTGDQWRLWKNGMALADAIALAASITTRETVIRAEYPQNSKLNPQ